MWRMSATFRPSTVRTIVEPRLAPTGGSAGRRRRNQRPGRLEVGDRACQKAAATQQKKDFDFIGALPFRPSARGRRILP